MLRRRSILDGHCQELMSKDVRVCVCVTGYVDLSISIYYVFMYIHYRYIYIYIFVHRKHNMLGPGCRTQLRCFGTSVQKASSWATMTTLEGEKQAPEVAMWQIQEYAYQPSCSGFGDHLLLGLPHSI